MKTQKQVVQENVQQYGYIAQTNEDLFKLINYKSSEKEFYTSLQFQAFKELQRRKATEDIKKITSANDSLNHLSFLQGYAHEEFWVIYLRRNNTIIKKVQHSKGGTSGTVVDVRLILKDAIIENASALILGHNHPSGELSPSEADKIMTNRIIESAKLMDIAVLDHVIIGGKGGYYSFSEKGLI